MRPALEQLLLCAAHCLLDNLSHVLRLLNVGLLQVFVLFRLFLQILQPLLQTGLDFLP